MSRPVPPPPPAPSGGERPARWLSRDPDLEARMRQPVRWGLGDAALGLLLAQAAALFGGAGILIAAGYTDQDAIDQAPVALLFLLQIPLWLGYGGVPVWASYAKGNGLVADFGWRFRLKDVPFGLGAGALTQLALPLIYIPIFLLFGEQDVSEAARELTDRAVTPFDTFVLVVILVVGAPIIEELFFRGLLLRSLERRWGTTVAVVVSSVVFAGIHLQLLQLPALVAFGVVAALLTVRSGRLGPAIWAHVGFNGVTAVVLLTAEGGSA